MDDIGEWRKIEIEIRKEQHGVTKLQWAKPVTLVSEGALIPWVVRWAKWKMQSQLNIPSVLTFIDIRFLPARVLFFVHYLLAQRPLDILWPLFDKGWSPKTFTFPWNVFFLNSFACVTLKVQSYIFMEQRFSGLQQRKNLLTQSLMLLMLKLLFVFFFNILTICTPRNTMDKGCGNLAASIGSTMLLESG